MGLSRDSVGIKSVDCGLEIRKRQEDDKVIALAGNPNVGKSTVFNEMTGMNQHTGNWPGKTVANAQGYANDGEQGYVMVDIPGCYSLMAHSTEEEVARDFICFENPDAVIVVCDATCLERNLNLVLQILEANRRAVVCVNLMDEAKKKSISIRFDVLEERLGVPVIGTAARSGKGLEQIYEGLKHVLELNKRLESAQNMEVVEGDYAEMEAVDVEDVELEAEAEVEAEETENAEAKMKIEEAGSKEAEVEAEVKESADVSPTDVNTEDTEAEAEAKNIEARDIEARDIEARDIEARDIEARNMETAESEAEKVKDIENEVRKTAEKAADRRFDENPAPRILIRYPEYIEAAIARLTPVVKKTAGEGVNIRWLCARLLDSNENLMEAVRKYLAPVAESLEVSSLLAEIREEWKERGITQKRVSDDMASVFVRKAEFICRGAVVYENQKYDKKDRLLDRLFTSKATGFPIMFLILLGVFWLTITGANYPSEMLSNGLFWLEDRISELFLAVGMPVVLNDLLVHGVYRVLAWVISVMLPPMAIFFPLFTLLEDFGYLPRVAFNLDRCFKRCAACGKQALTMCMGFGCNAAGIIGCRIIDSPRERLIAMITNNFVPCNGRFPTMIAIITMFFVGSAAGAFSSVLSAAILAGVIVLGVLMTLLISKILSATVLKGVPSSFTLELPPYRKPQIGKVIVRSIFDRTLFVLGRAIVVAAPAGLIIWLMANISVGDATLLAHCSGFLDPFAQVIGMDGVILLAFILGFPANEIVVPIIIMAYMAEGSLLDISDLSVLRDLLVSHGWTWITAVSTMLFSLMHWPCSTTCLTIKKETQSVKWTIASFLVPTVTGIVVCFLFTTIARAFL
ncbi:Fe2+ transport system protein B [Hungatella effluvii]|uniref:Fe2+ transport system protein B n=1 Tax=Hungatella effluvii TaxID=1096246 RepID=A0A2V3Y1S1_9FIRM|nr:FeoB small GTPase domain-containing protein [Hungatella effluvii]PXX52067.1 Fe2+ transport system protein B [Hungatella effluvii]